MEYVSIAGAAENFGVLIGDSFSPIPAVAESLVGGDCAWSIAHQKIEIVRRRRRRRSDFRSPVIKTIFGIGILSSAANSVWPGQDGETANTSSSNGKEWSLRVSSAEFKITGTGEFDNTLAVLVTRDLFALENPPWWITRHLPSRVSWIGIEISRSAASACDAPSDTIK